MSKRLFFILAVGLIWPLSALAPAGAQASYPMTCQIGTMNGIYINPPAIAGVTFAKSNGAVATGLQPGQCAFGDRAVKADEPNQLCFSPAGITGIFLNGKAITGGASFSGPGERVLLNAVFGPTTLMNFTVHQGPGINGKPCFIVDHFGV